jgi:pyridine nucleotide-disulfide oxidoreductase
VRRSLRGDNKRYTTTFERGGRVATESFALASAFEGETQVIADMATDKRFDTRKLLGVWALGAQATELVHIGQAVMGLGGTLDYFVEGVFNYPTLAECYKVAALDGFNELQELASVSAVSPGATVGAPQDEEATSLGATGLGDLTAVSAHGL